jgi:glycosyltransferase involved in cell wall biosynthesis
LKIGVSYLSNLGNSWSMSDGVLNALDRMGHDVVAALHIHGDIPNSAKPDPSWNDFDFVLVLEAEYIPKEYWTHLTCPKALWFTETSRREDLHFEGLYQEQIRFPKVHPFFVALQDAREYGGTWLPHGVDTEFFKPSGVPKVHEIGYFGQIYPRRVRTWKMVCDAGIKVHRIERIVTERIRMNEILIHDINQCKMILALPAYSHSFTTRPLEVMACGVPIVVPHMADFARCNEEQFSYSPAYYDEHDPQSLKRAISEAYQIDPACILREVQEFHTLEIRLQKIIDTMKAGI